MQAGNDITTPFRVDVAQVGNYGTSPWLTGTVNLGPVPPGTFLTVTIKVAAANLLDSILNSEGYFDNVRIVSV